MPLDLLFTLLAAFCGGWILLKIKVPGGMLVGAILGAAALNITAGSAVMTTEAKVFAQIAAGAFIGCTVRKEDIREMRRLLKPAVITLSCMLLLNLAVGFAIYAVGDGLDLVTALFCAVPGGISDIPIIAADLGASAPQVAVMQFVRLLVGIGIFPGLIRWTTRGEPAEPIRAETQPDVKTEKKKSEKLTSLGLTLAVASAAGILGKYLGIPAGALVFAMLGVILLKLKGADTCLPMWLKRFAQLLSGAYIGCGLNYQDLLEMRHLILPMILLLAGYTANCFIVGKLLRRFCGMSRRVGMLVATPAGATDMALISSDLGVDSPDLIVLQIIRLTVVVSIFPTVIQLITMWLAG